MHQSKLDVFYELEKDRDYRKRMAGNFDSIDDRGNGVDVELWIKI